jgi:hypothetical protein
MSQFGVASPAAGVVFHINRYVKFMLAFGAFFILGGGGVDFARASFAEAHLETAASVVADNLTHTALGLSSRSLQDRAEKMLAPDLADFDDPSASVSTRKVGPSVRVYVAAGLPTTFLRLFLRDRLSLEAVSTGEPPRPSRNIAWWT